MGTYTRSPCRGPRTPHRGRMAVSSAWAERPLNVPNEIPELGSSKAQIKRSSEATNCHGCGQSPERNRGGLAVTCANQQLVTEGVTDVPVD